MDKQQIDEKTSKNNRTSFMKNHFGSTREKNFMKFISFRRNISFFLPRVEKIIYVLSQKDVKCDKLKTIKIEMIGEKCYQNRKGERDKAISFCHLSMLVHFGSIQLINISE